ncbi:copper chaperone PCu(A)C [Pukyongiella litopenaei]|uniref:Copper chaperone PCu(A)C n=1 Tax=Pukyongiella litopenaei TaxID=2605946 RepID=A0A2S0MST4_9RHOB|nr:copper chaperone PCu(A)C [Pukyongiella litopenaei]AVO38801.1 copper chaperone PCu(A)C [Pukyongiella litopenaei]
MKDTRHIKSAFVAIVLTAMAMAAIVIVSRRSGPELLLTQATAAPVAGEPGRVAVFLNVVNRGGPDRIVAVRSIAAQRARLDSTVADAGLPIPGDATAALEPDGAHIRMDGVGGSLDDGRMIPVTLRFETAGEISTRARLVAPTRRGDAGSFGLFGLGDICRVGDGEPVPGISLAVREDGDGWIVEVQAENFTFAPDLADTAHVPGTGHGHLYVGGLKLQRLYQPTARIGALPPGTHEVRVTLNSNDHRAFVVGEQPVTAVATIVAR